MFSRLQDAIEAGHSAVSEIQSAAEVQNLSALLILDELGPMAEDVRARHFDAAAASGQRPLLILGPEAELEHSSLQFLCEFLPRSQDIVRATGERPDTVLRYRMTRLNLIFDKWDVAQCRWIGVSAAEIVEAWTAEKTAERRDILFSPAH